MCYTLSTPSEYLVYNVKIQQTKTSIVSLSTWRVKKQNIYFSPICHVKQWIFKLTFQFSLLPFSPSQNLNDLLQKISVWEKEKLKLISLFFPFCCSCLTRSEYATKQKCNLIISQKVKSTRRFSKETKTKTRTKKKIWS